MDRVRVVMRAEEGADGTYPLALRISKNGKPSFIYLDERIKHAQWDSDKKWISKSHPNYKRLDNFLTKKLSEAKDKYLELETAKPDASVKAIRSKIKPKAKDTFFGQAQSYLDRLKAGGDYNQYTADQPRVKHFKEFLKDGDIAFTDITVGLLERFKAHCKGGLALSERSALNHLAMVRCVFAEARKNEIIDDKVSPFGKGKMQIKFPDSNKVGLNREEIKRLEELQIDNPLHAYARDLWVFSFNLAGMRISDVLRLTWSDIRDGRLHYIMGKNEKGDSIKIPDKAMAIAEKFRANKDDTGLVFPDLKDEDLSDEFSVERRIAFMASRYDKFLRKFVAPAAGIEKKITMHITRHTFAQLAGDKIDIRTLQMLYRHSKIETTIGYQSNFIHKKKDDALDQVLGL